MIIGTFVYDSASDCFSGDIATLHFQFSPVEIKPAQKKSANGPDYRLISDTSHGHVELGSAWKRTDKNGKTYLSVELDAPLLDRPFNAALFTGDTGATASLFWTRRKAQAEVAAPKAATTKPKLKKAA